MRERTFEWKEKECKKKKKNLIVFWRLIVFKCIDEKGCMEMNWMWQTVLKWKYYASLKDREKNEKGVDEDADIFRGLLHYLVGNSLKLNIFFRKDQNTI